MLQIPIFQSGLGLGDLRILSEAGSPAWRPEMTIRPTDLDDHSICTANGRLDPLKA